MTTSDADWAAALGASVTQARTLRGDPDPHHWGAEAEAGLRAAFERPAAYVDDDGAEDVARERAEGRDLPSSVRAVAGEGFEGRWRA